MATLNNLLLRQAYKDLDFKPCPSRAIEIFKFKGLEPVVHQEEYLVRFDDWLQQRGAYTAPDYGEAHPLIGGIRLIFQEWREPEASIIATKTTMPFEKSIFEEMVKAQFLPNDSPAIFYHRKYTTPKLNIQHNGTLATLVYQSPNFVDSFTTLALVYNPSTSVTSGFLGYVQDEFNNTIIPSLIDTSDQIMHPLLLPILCLNKWIIDLQSRTFQEYRPLSEIQGLIKNNATSEVKNSRALSNSHALHRSHVDIIEMHERLSESTDSFIQESTRDLKLALEELKPTIPADKKEALEGINQEFEACVSQLEITANGLSDMRKKLLDCIDMQLKVLYSLMQQRDSRMSQRIAEHATKAAVASKRDMKAIAVLAMLFLPGTAVASIFSIGRFFSTADNSRVTVSSEVWLYWAIVLPLTGVVLTVWLSWLRLEKTRAHKEEDEEIGVV